MPAHKVFVPVALVPTDHDCAKLEGYSLLLYSDKGLHLCAVESFFYEMPLIAFYFCYSESVFMQKNKISHTRQVAKMRSVL